MPEITAIPIANLIGVFLVSFFCSILSSLAGIGGGALFTPLFILIGGIDVKSAIFLSLITMLGTTLSRIIYYLMKKHYDSSDRYLSNYQIIRIFLPFNGNFTYIGFLLNQVLPDWVILILIVLLMIVVTTNSTISLIKFWKEWKHITQITEIPNIIIEQVADENNNEIESIQRGDTLIDLVNHQLYSLLIVGLIIFFSLIRNSAETAWHIYLVQAVLMLIVGYFSILYVKVEDKWKKLTNFQVLESDLDWSNWSTNIKVSVISSISGICSALLGIGSGLIMNPLMLHLHIHPSVMLATSGWTTFFSVIMSTIQYIVHDVNLLEWVHGVVFGIGFIGTIISLIILKYIESHKSVKFVITAILVVSMVLCSIMLIIINVMDLDQS